MNLFVIIYWYGKQINYPGPVIGCSLKKATKKPKNVQKTRVEFLKKLRRKVLTIGSFEDPAKFQNRQRAKSTTTLRKPNSKCLFEPYPVHVSS